MNKIPRPVRFIPAMLWMWIIFRFSGRAAVSSTKESQGLAAEFVSLYTGFFPMNMRDQIRWIHVLEPYVRKGAHMIEFAVLFLLLFFALRAYFGSYINAAAVDLMICIIYAVTDEWHQTFVYGRAGLISDVIIDSAGALTAFVLILISGHIRKT